MNTDDVLIEKVKKLYEASTGWGESSAWVNRDFIALSEKIQERTSISLSHVTLKRVWGKVKYESLPTAHTLDTLVQYLGFENWRDFKLKQENGCAKQPVALAAAPPTAEIIPIKTTVAAKASRRNLFRPAIAAAICAALVCTIAFLPRKNAVVNPSDYSFSSKTVVTKGLPNSVIFNFDASNSPFDSVIIQQSWDKTRQIKMPKSQRQQTCIYYYPDYYHAKLIVGNHVVKEHDLLIKSDGWMNAVEQSPVPVYFKPQDFMLNGKMALTKEKILSRNINMQPSPPTTDYVYVDDMGEIYSDDFVFETSLKDDYSEGAGVCQLTQVYLLCKETGIWVPLCAKGCVSGIDMEFTNFYTSGKREDLSAFGVDFSNFVKLRIESKNGKAVISINGKPVYTVDHKIIKSKIVGFFYRFSGTGSVDYVRFGNGKVKYDDEF